MRSRLIALVTAVLAVAAPVATADAASSYSRVLRAYETRGSVPPCQFTSPQLQSALKSIDTYGAQYFADFTNAVQAALTQRASGACAPQHASRSGGTAAAARSTPAPPLHLGPVTAATGASLPAPILLLAALGAVVALLAAVAGLAWWRGWSPRWAGAWGHALGEAGYRARDTWGEFDDWLRSGRDGGR
jgi:hypothetical protein